MSYRTLPPGARTCVVCGKPQAQSLRPFCSRRCADVDLNRWLSGAYAVPALEDDGDDPTESPPHR